MLRSMLGGDGVTHRRTDHPANGAMDLLTSARRAFSAVC
jgi:hypothetical protein